MKKNPFFFVILTVRYRRTDLTSMSSDQMISEADIL